MEKACEENLTKRLKSRSDICSLQAQVDEMGKRLEQMAEEDRQREMLQETLSQANSWRPLEQENLGPAPSST